MYFLKPRHIKGYKSTKANATSFAFVYFSLTRIKKMKNRYALTLLTILAPIFSFAQEKLNFDKQFIHCENKWIALPADTSGAHPFGFVYIDPTAGLTLDFSGTFKIDATGKYLVKKREVTSVMKYRLDRRNNASIAVIPPTKFNELDIKASPDWLASYKVDENSANYFYIRGYTFNAWGDCKSAVNLLEKAYQKDPDYRGLRAELAFSYNCLDRYEDAIKVLKVAATKEPMNAYVNKELIFAQVNTGAIDTAMQTHRSFLQKNGAKNYDTENAFNILNGLYKKNDIVAFDKWLAETNIQNDKRFASPIEKMKAQLKK